MYIIRTREFLRIGRCRDVTLLLYIQSTDRLKTAHCYLDTRFSEHRPGTNYKHPLNDRHQNMPREHIPIPRLWYASQIRIRRARARLAIVSNGTGNSGTPENRPRPAGYNDKKQKDYYDIVRFVWDICEKIKNKYTSAVPPQSESVACAPSPCGIISLDAVGIAPRGLGDRREVIAFPSTDLPVRCNNNDHK